LYTDGSTLYRLNIMFEKLRTMFCLNYGVCQSVKFDGYIIISKQNLFKKVWVTSYNAFSCTVHTHSILFLAKMCVLFTANSVRYN